MQTASTLTPEQVELRKGRITSTRIVKLVQGRALDVFNDMMGIAPPIPDNARMRWGRKLERAIIEGAAEERGWGVVHLQPGTVVRGDYATSPDAYVGGTWRAVWSEVERIVEAKNRGAERAGEYGDEPLESEIVQTQWHMDVCGVPEASVCILLGGNDLRIFDLQHDGELCAGLREIADRFLTDHIRTGRPPPMDASDAAADYLRAKFPMHRAPLREDPEAEALVRSYREACAAADSAEEAKKRIGNLLRERIGESEGVCGPGFRATWKASKGSKATDWESLARSLCQSDPLMIAKFTTERPGSRRLLVTVKTEG